MGAVTQHLTCIYPDQRLRNLEDQQNMYDQFGALVHKKIYIHTNTRQHETRCFRIQDTLDRSPKAGGLGAWAILNTSHTATLPELFVSKLKFC
jgi:hypothetical protein